MLNTNPSGPGRRTSEFAATLGGGVGIALLSFGVVSTVQEADAVVQLVTSAITGVSAIFTIGWIIVEYIKGRKNIKGLLIQRGIIGQEPPQNG